MNGHMQSLHNHAECLAVYSPLLAFILYGVYYYNAGTDNIRASLTDTCIHILFHPLSSRLYLKDNKGITRRIEHSIK